MEIGKVTAATESVKFALRMLEDMQSSKAVALSGATELSDVSSDLRFVQDELRQFHSVLMNAQANWEDSQNTDPNVHNCTTEIQDVVKSTEIAIFTFINKVVDIKPSTVPDIFKSLNPEPVNFFALHNLKTDIRKILTKFKKANETGVTLTTRVILLFQQIQSRVGNINLSGPSDKAIGKPARQSLSNIDHIWLLDLEIHQKCIIRRLVDQRLQTRSVIQVVGTEGFAKTVLAEKIYQSTEVKTHFEACFWLFPQIRFDTKYNKIDFKPYLFKPIDILRKMLLKLGDTNSFDARDDDHDIMSRLRQFLTDKRCLVVVDNNWTELWTLVNITFPDGNNGSRVLITTEKEGQNEYKYQLPVLNYEEYRTDVNMGDEDQWYSKLPGVLQMCIAYTAAVFPCGSIVVADSLIRLWIVEGIIPHEEGRTMENIAESYIDHLVQRGLLHIIGAYYHNQPNHPIRSIILHPSLHRICESKSRSTSDENEILPVKVILSVDAFDKNLTNLHRLALHMPYQCNHISSFEKGPTLQCFNNPSLHSLFFFGYVVQVTSSPFSFVRVLAVFSSHIQFPEEYTPCWLDELINLRYLGFIVCLVEGGSLGKTLDRLGNYNLKILDLSQSIVSGLSEFIENNKIKVNIVGPVREELRRSWSPVPDMSQ